MLRMPGIKHFWLSTYQDCLSSSVWNIANSFKTSRMMRNRTIFWWLRQWLILEMVARWEYIDFAKRNDWTNTGTSLWSYADGTPAWVFSWAQYISVWGTFLTDLQNASNFTFLFRCKPSWISNYLNILRFEGKLDFNMTNNNTQLVSPIWDSTNTQRNILVPFSVSVEYTWLAEVINGVYNVYWNWTKYTTAITGGAYTGAAPTTNYIGREAAWYYWNGLIWPVRCWNRWLTNEEKFNLIWTF